MREVISDIGLVVCTIGVVIQLNRRRSTFPDLLAGFVAALGAGLFLGLRSEDWFRAVGIGLSTGVLVVFGMRATRPRPVTHNRADRSAQHTFITLTLWIEAVLAAVATYYFVFGDLRLALILLGFSAVAIVIEVLALRKRQL